jgi:hypothetical protein
MKRSITCLLVAALIFSTSAGAATLKSGTCHGISTPQGYKYVGTYCVDFQCSVTTTLMFDSWCPYSIDL